MKVSIEISMYPLREAYCQPIIEFIERLANNAKVSIERNSMSTHIYGDYTDVMDTLTAEVLTVLEKMPETVFVIKLIGTDRERVNIHGC
ncbi:MAG: hypothetical protein GXO35_07080 [Gammaproteobacteria bacterium]|nr:hypothetical protein [Gammaproteobacteria bacterium]